MRLGGLDAKGATKPDYAVLRALPGGVIPARTLRLFWSWRKPVTITTKNAAREAVATILQEGAPADWRNLDLVALASSVDDLPLLGGKKNLWTEISKETAALQHNLHRVLTEDQRTVLRVAAAVLPAWGFELAGGTALAGAYLGHRRSQDLAFFTSAREIQGGLEQFIAACEASGLGVDQDPQEVAPAFARLYVREVKVEIARDAPFRISPSHTTLEGMPVRSLPDLAADKTLALFDRAATRDFVDLYELMRTRYDMSHLIRLARQKDTGFNIGWFIKALQQVERVDPAAAETLVPLDFDQMKADIRAATKRLVRQELDREGPEL